MAESKPISRDELTEQPEGAPKAKPTLGLSMIVKNAAEDLRACLSSARSVVDQIVIVDTGSTDDTIEIAKEFGAEIYHFTWNDSFADARNAAIDPMRTDWILVLDADEELSPESLGLIRKLIESTPAEVGTFQVVIRNYFVMPFVFFLGNVSRRNTDPYERAKNAASYCEHKMSRLFRRNPAIRFQNRLHETVDHTTLAAGYQLGIANFLILHYGNLRANEQKRLYYRKMGRKKLEESPESALAWYEVGSEELQAGNSSRALRYFERSYKLRPNASAAYCIALIHNQEHRWREALETLSLIPDDCSLALAKFALKGEVEDGKGDLKAARETYSQALEVCKKEGKQGEVALQAKIESRLGFVEARLGDPNTGIPRIESAVEKMPEVFEFQDSLVKAYLVCNRIDLAAGAQDRMLTHHASEKAIARAAALHRKAGNLARADALLKKGVELLPKSAKLRTLLGDGTEVCA